MYPSLVSRYPSNPAPVFAVSVSFYKYKHANLIAALVPVPTATPHWRRRNYPIYSRDVAFVNTAKSIDPNQTDIFIAIVLCGS